MLSSFLVTRTSVHRFINLQGSDFRLVDTDHSLCKRWSILHFLTWNIKLREKEDYKYKLWTLSRCSLRFVWDVSSRRISDFYVHDMYKLKDQRFRLSIFLGCFRFSVFCFYLPSSALNIMLYFAYYLCCSLSLSHSNFFLYVHHFYYS